VKHPAGARHPEIGLEVAGAVPGQGFYPVTAFESQVVEGAHELAGAGAELGVGDAPDLARRAPADELGVGGVLWSVLEQHPGAEGTSIMVPPR